MKKIEISIMKPNRTKKTDLSYLSYVMKNVQCSMYQIISSVLGQARTKSKRQELKISRTLIYFSSANDGLDGASKQVFWFLTGGIFCVFRTHYRI